MSDTQPTAAPPDHEPDHQPDDGGQPTLRHEAEAKVAAPAAPAAPRTRLRDLAFGLRSIAAVAVAGVILGGFAGYGIHAATDGQDGRSGPGGGFRGGFQGGGPGGGFQGGRGQNFPGGGQGVPNGGPGGQQLPPQSQVPSTVPTPAPTT